MKNLNKREPCCVSKRLGTFVPNVRRNYIAKNLSSVPVCCWTVGSCWSLADIGWRVHGTYSCPSLSSPWGRKIYWELCLVDVAHRQVLSSSPSAQLTQTHLWMRQSWFRRLQPLTLCALWWLKKSFLTDRLTFNFLAVGSWDISILTQRTELDLEERKRK